MKLIFYFISIFLSSQINKEKMVFLSPFLAVTFFAFPSEACFPMGPPPSSPATLTPVAATTATPGYYVSTNVGTPSPYATPFNMSNPLVTKYGLFSANFLVSLL